MSDLPATSLAVEITRPGPPDVLRPTKRPLRRPGRGEVLVQVAAAGVNRPDLLQREGRYPPPPGASDIPGLEVAGTVVAVGDEVDAWSTGDEVCALVAGGGYAEFCLVPAPQVLPRPRGLGPVEAAALPEAVFTVWTNVFERGRLASGETFLVHGGASGIGTTAIQLARARGARVLTTAGTATKCTACRDLGAERAINYRDEDFVAVVDEVTGGRGVDVILDMVGGSYLSRNLDSLARDGRLVLIAFLGGATAEVDLRPVLQRWLTVTGSTLRPRPIEEKGRIARAVLSEVWPLLESGAMAPVVHATFPLVDAAEAHRQLEAGHHIGKIVLTV